MNNITANILKGIEEKIETGNKISFEILTSTKKSNEILSKEIKGELKSQTHLLKGILGVLSKQKNIKDNEGNDNVSKLISSLTGKSSARRLKAVQEPLGKITDIVIRLKNAINDIDEKKFELFSSFLDSGKRILSFAVFTALAAPLLLISTLITMPLLFLWVNFFSRISDKRKDIGEGGRAMMFLAITTAIITMTIVSAAYMLGNPLKLLSSFMLVTASMALVVGAYALISSIKKPLNDGAKTMLFLAITTAIIVSVVLMSAFFIEKMSSSSLFGGFALVMGSIVILAGGFWLISQVKGKIIQGTLTMLFVGIVTALIVGTVIGTAFLLQKLSEKDNATSSVFGALGIVAFSILGLGLAMVMIGSMSSMAIKGALAMLITSAALGVYTLSLIQFKKAKVSATDVALVSGSLTLVGLAFTAIGNPVTIGFTLAGAAAMLLVSSSVLVYTSALKTFSEAKWTNEKSETLKTSITKIVSGFKEAFSELSIKDFLKIGAGVVLLGGIGTSLGQLGRGLSHFANLEMVNFKEDKDGNLIVDPNSSPKAINPQAISRGIKELISPLIGKNGPLYQLGKTEGLFFKGPIGNGINLLGKLGNSISDFAKGISGISKLEFGSIDTDENGNFIIGKEKTKINPSAISNSIKELVNPLVAKDSILAKLGKDAGTFFDGPTGKGINLLGKLGGAIGDFAKGLVDIIDLKIPLYDKDGKLIEGKFQKLDENFGERVGNSIQKMVTALTGPLEEIGGKKSGFFSSSTNYENGIKMLTQLGEPLSKMAEMINSLSKENINSKVLEDRLNAVFNPLGSFFSSTKIENVDINKGKQIINLATSYIESIVKIEEPAEISKMFIEISKGINSIDLNKLKELNNLAYNLKSFAEEMSGNFSELTEVIEGLSQALSNIPDNQTLNINQGTTSNINTGVSGTTPGTANTIIEKTDIEPLVKELKSILNTLQGGLDVEVKNEGFFT